MVRGQLLAGLSPPERSSGSAVDRGRRAEIAARRLFPVSRLILQQVPGRGAKLEYGGQLGRQCRFPGGSKNVRNNLIAAHPRAISPLRANPLAINDESGCFLPENRPFHHARCRPRRLSCWPIGSSRTCWKNGARARKRGERQAPVRVGSIDLRTRCPDPLTPLADVAQLDLPELLGR